MIYILFAILIAIVIMITYTLIFNYYAKSKCKKTSNEIFSRDINIALPTIKMGASYGYPTVEVLFNNKEDMESAQMNGNCKLFEEKIQQIFSSIKGFDASRAINYTYIGRTYDFCNITIIK